MFIEFTGTAGQVSRAFHTEIHALNVGGVSHIGNMSDPSIPAALAPVVVGVHALHDFMPHPLHRDLGSVKRDNSTGRWTRPAQPGFTINDGTSSTFYAVAPADFATIYNLNPLFTEGYRGAGQTVVVIEDTNIKNASDVTTFRSAFGLSGYAGTFSQVNPTGKTTCKNPGENGAEGEAALDAEWAGASAPDAAIELASCADTRTVFGGLIAIENLINGTNVPHDHEHQLRRVRGRERRRGERELREHLPAGGRRGRLRVRRPRATRARRAATPTRTYATHGHLR